MPAQSKRNYCLAGYASFADILPEFAGANLLPPGFHIERLDNASGVFSTLCANTAKWHKSCRLFFYRTQLDRAAKCELESISVVGGESSNADSVASEETVKRVMYRRSMSNDVRKSSTVYKTLICFLCSNANTCSTDALDGAATDGIDLNVRDCAKILCDANLLAKISDGDLSSHSCRFAITLQTIRLNMANTRNRSTTQERWMNQIYPVLSKCSYHPGDRRLKSNHVRTKHATLS